MVHFVGAGSGAADLITVRGAKLLGEADVVIYAGSLVNPALLDYTTRVEHRSLVQACCTLGKATVLAETLLGREKVYRLKEGGMGSEDFASYTYELPCAYLLLGAGTPQEDPRYGKPMHNEAVVFNEDVLPTGAALHTLFALRMLAQET